VNLHVETVGAGPPLVLLHGWAMHGGLWHPMLPELARRHRVYVVDLPGHGHSKPVAPYTVARVACELESCFAGAREPLQVWGWSLGGLVAMEWALAHPGRIARLLLLSTSPCFVQRADWSFAMEAETLKRFGDELKVSYRATLLRFLTLQVKDSTEGKATLSHLRQSLFDRGSPDASSLAAALDLLAETDLRAGVAALDAQVAIVSGERDMIAPVEAGEWLAREVPGARFRALPLAGHAPFLSHPNEVMEVWNALAQE
jgi:pimeloyl-[acyl-carrier protein] methyl ester esterase